MWLPRQINLSNCITVRRFDMMAAIAKVMKGCHFFYACAENHTLYGTSSDAYFIREVQMPAVIQFDRSFSFRLDLLDQDMLAQYMDFIIPIEFQFLALPLEKQVYFHEYDIKYQPDGLRAWHVKKGDTFIPSIDLLGVDTDKYIQYPAAQRAFNGFFASRQTLSTNSYLFENAHKIPAIVTMQASKAVAGEQFVSLKGNNGRDYSIYVCKGIFSLNKDDTLDIIVHDRLDQPSLFDVQFRVVHNKNTIRYIIDGKFIENTTVTFVHLI